MDNVEFFIAVIAGVPLILAAALGSVILHYQDKGRRQASRIRDLEGVIQEIRWRKRWQGCGCKVLDRPRNRYL